MNKSLIQVTHFNEKRKPNKCCNEKMLMLFQNFKKLEKILRNCLKIVTAFAMYIFNCHECTNKAWCIFKKLQNIRAFVA